MSPEAEESEPVYLELADALELYAAIINATPAQAADQLRDRAGLESALGRPYTTPTTKAPTSHYKPQRSPTASPKARAAFWPWVLVRSATG